MVPVSEGSTIGDLRDAIARRAGVAVPALAFFPPSRTVLTAPPKQACFIFYTITIHIFTFLSLKM